MRLVPVVPVQLQRFGSHGVTVHHPTNSIDELLSFDGGSSVVIGRLDEGGVIGRHPATDLQLLMVVTGKVVVATDSATAELIEGQAVLFEPGEQHETRASTAASIVVFERRMDPHPSGE